MLGIYGRREMHAGFWWRNSTTNLTRDKGRWQVPENTVIEPSDSTKCGEFPD